MRNSSLKRVSGYGVAAAAVLGATQSHADVNSFTGIEATGSNTNTSTLLSFSLTGVVATDGSNVADEQFNFNHVGTASSSKNAVTATNGIAGFNVTPLVYGTVIGSTTVFTSNGNTDIAGFSEVEAKGPWTSGERAYMGLRFNNGGTANYGWADITTVDNHTITLHGFAYDNTGSAIAAGSVTPIPEPSQIALFAFGAAGVALVHRRRKQAVAAK